MIQVMCEVFKLNKKNNVALATLYQATLPLQYHLTNNTISTILWGKPTLLKLHYTK